MNKFLADLWNKDCRYCWCRSISSWSYEVWRLHCWSNRLCFRLLGAIGGVKQNTCIFRILNYNVCPLTFSIFCYFVQSVFDFQLIKSLLSRSDFRYVSKSSSTKQDIYELWFSFLLNSFQCLNLRISTWLRVNCYIFRFIFDAMHAVTGAYAKPIFVDKLGANPVSNCFDGMNWKFII